MNYTLPPQQILQANGKASIDAIRMAPNSSVLIADTTQPIVWKCVSDGLGNVTAEAFDITHHKTEEEVEKASEILRREMENAYKFSVPIVTDLHCGKTWFEAKD